MSASRKLYEGVAKGLKLARPKTEATDGEFQVWMNSVAEVSQAFYNDNANFNATRFEEACGIPAQ